MFRLVCKPSGLRPSLFAGELASPLKLPSTSVGTRVGKRTFWDSLYFRVSKNRDAFISGASQKAARLFSQVNSDPKERSGEPSRHAVLNLPS